MLQGTFRRSAICASAALASLSMVVFAAPSVTVKEPVSAPTCLARTVGSAIEVMCPTATVAEFLAVLQQTTGLKSEYPRELGSARVSVRHQTIPLLELLESALSAFNFAVWLDPGASSTVRMRIVDRRGSGPDQRAQSVGPSTAQALEPSPIEIGESTTGLDADGSFASSSAAPTPQNDFSEQAQERERFADSIVDALPLEAVGADPAASLVPSAAPRPQNDLWEQARERERFADSIVDALPLEAVVADPAASLVPQQ